MPQHGAGLDPLELPGPAGAPGRAVPGPWHRSLEGSTCFGAISALWSAEERDEVKAQGARSSADGTGLAGCPALASLDPVSMAAAHREPHRHPGNPTDTPGKAAELGGRLGSVDLGNDGLQGRAIRAACSLESLELRWHQSQGDGKDQKVLAAILANCSALLGTASTLPKKGCVVARTRIGFEERLIALLNVSYDSTLRWMTAVLSL